MHSVSVLASSMRKEEHVSCQDVKKIRLTVFLALPAAALPRDMTALCAKNLFLTDGVTKQRRSWYGMWCLVLESSALMVLYRRQLVFWGPIVNHYSVVLFTKLSHKYPLQFTGSLFFQPPKKRVFHGLVYKNSVTDVFFHSTIHPVQKIPLPCPFLPWLKPTLAAHS